MVLYRFAHRYWFCLKALCQPGGIFLNYIFFSYQQTGISMSHLIKSIQLRNGIKLLALSTFGFLIAACSGPQQDESKLNFIAGEHMLLGDGAYAELCGEIDLGCSQRIPGKNGEEAMSYGELIALGDFYDDPEKVWQDTASAKVSERLNRVKKLWQDQVGALKQRETDPLAPLPDHNIQFTVLWFPYVNLALDNIKHFGWHNIKTYLTIHQQAITLALEANQLRNLDKERSEQLFYQALFYNGIADHFLTDSFAAGHIRTPRAEAVTWAESEGLSYVAGAVLSQFLHDNDGHIHGDGDHGLKVTNARGDQWETLCDGQLLYANKGSNDAYTLAKEAVHLSLEEVIDVYQQGVMPEDYAALMLVPYPSEAETQLVETFPAISSRKAKQVYDGMPFYKTVRTNETKALNSKKVKTFFKALPDVMKTFRNNIKTDYENSPALSVLPPEYVKGMMEIK